jgi:hypothetical protein
MGIVDQIKGSDVSESEVLVMYVTVDGESTVRNISERQNIVKSLEIAMENKGKVEK